jgi:tRNA-specific 2-thiouridylase
MNGDVQRSRGMVAVAMSGGLDSSVAAWLLSRPGSDAADGGDGGRPVVGLSMLLWDRAGENVHGRCCGALDLGDARRVAAQCGIPHYTLRLEEEFRRHVVDPFVESYLAGETPVPCTRCNTWLKFDLLLDRARAVGAEKLATGHYARIVAGADGPELHAARHLEKDQSYYLWELRQEQLARSLFPLGELTKEETREQARLAGLVTAEKGESMELCFVAGGVREFVEEQVQAAPGRYAGAAAVRLGEAARVVDREGRELGSAEPAYRYTVGQRKGLGVTSKSPLFVLEVRPQAHQLVVGDETDLFAARLHGRDLHWIGPRERQALEVRATVKIRSRHEGAAARIRPDGRGGASVEFERPQRGVTPGQAAVFYDGSRVLGGCWITAGESAPA